MKKIIFIIFLMLLAIGLTSCSEVKEKRKIIIGTAALIEPMTFVDENGVITGFDIEIIKRVMELNKIEFEIVNMEFFELIPALKAGEIDIVASVLTITPERSKDMLFSIPYFNAGQVLIITEDTFDIESIEDLKDKKIAIMEGTTAEKTANEYFDENQIILYEDWFFASQDLLKGDIDASIAESIIFHKWMKENPGFKTVGESLTNEFYGFAMRKDEIELKKDIDKALRGMKRDDELTEMKDRWL